MAPFFLSDEAWVAIKPHLPRKQLSAHRVDDRRVISGMLHVLKLATGVTAPADCAHRPRSTARSTAGHRETSRSNCSRHCLMPAQ